MDKKVRSLEMRLPDMESGEPMGSVGVRGVSKEQSLSLLALGDKASNFGDHGGGVVGTVAIEMGVERVVSMTSGCTVGGVIRVALVSNTCIASAVVSNSWIGMSNTSAPGRVAVVGGEEWMEENEPGTSKMAS
jgi:phage tail tube protein FII